MKTSRMVSFMLTVSVIVAGAVAAWNVLPGTPSRGAEPGAGDRVNVTPTPDILREAGTIAAAIETLRATNRPVAEALESWTRADAAAIVSALPSFTRRCETFVSRGVSLCERTNRPVGSLVELFETSSVNLPGFQVERDDALDTFTYLLDSRHPRVEMLALRGDGAYLAVIGVDPRPALQFPGPVVLGGGDIVAVYVLITRLGGIVDAAQKSATAPPLEPVRNELRLGSNSYEILAVDDSFRARERAVNDENEAHRKDPPTR